MAAAGNVIFPGNFHPVGTQHAAAEMVRETFRFKVGNDSPTDGGIWIVVGGSGGFGSAARIALASRLGAHTINVSFDAQPNSESSNKIRVIGSPGFHRNLAIEKQLRSHGLQASSYNGDAFDPSLLSKIITDLREQFGPRCLKGVLWALAAPRALDPRTGQMVSSALKPIGQAAKVKTFAGPEGDNPPKIVEILIPPGSPEEAIATQYVMGGSIVERWVTQLHAAQLLKESFELLTISYRGNPMNESIYRNGLIGLAKADLEFHTNALNAWLDREMGGRAIAVEGPAVVTEASGGIPGVPLYMALIRQVLGQRYENPLASMTRMIDENFVPGKSPTLDAEGLLRMDDRELATDVQNQMQQRFDQLSPGDAFSRECYDDFIQAYAQTRGYEVPGVDYSAEFETDELCRSQA